MTMQTQTAFSGVIHPDVAATAFINVAAKEAPLTAALMAMNKKRETSQTTLKWWGADPGARRTQVNNVGGYDTDDTSIIVDDGSIFQAGQLIKVESTGEVLLVTGVSTNTLTVVRSVGSTAGANIADDAWFYNLGWAKEEGSTGHGAVNTGDTAYTSYTQIFERTVDLSRSLQKSTTDIGEAKARERQKKLIEIGRDMELAALWSEAGEETTSTGKPRRTTMGIFEHATVNVADANGTLTRAELDDWLGQLFLKGSDYRLALGGRTATSVIRSLYEPSQQATPDQKSVGFTFTRIETPHGDLDLVTHPLMVGGYAGQIVGVDPEEIEMRYLKDSDLKLHENVGDSNVDGTFDKYLGEIGFTWGNPNAHGILSNISVAG